MNIYVTQVTSFLIKVYGATSGVRCLNGVQTNVSRARTEICPGQHATACTSDVSMRPTHTCPCPWLMGGREPLGVGERSQMLALLGPAS
jgi:hypothetical protein